MGHPPKRFCAAPGCANRVAKGLCSGHARLRDSGRPNADIRHLYTTARWMRMRQFILSDEPLCRECQKQGIVEPTTDVDHIIPHGGDETRFWDWTNLQGLCHACHSRKTQRGE